MPSTQTRVIDGLSTSVAIKAPCAVAATTNITLAGLQTISSVALEEGMRVLATAQTDPVDNGIYVATSGDWTRALDADGPRDFVSGTIVLIQSDADGLGYQLVTDDDPVIVGESDLVFEARDFDALLRGELASTTSSSDGARLVGNRRTEAGSIAETVNTVLNRIVFAASFGFSTSNSAAQNATDITAAIAAVTASGGTVILPPGIFACNTFSVPAQVVVRGAGMFATRLQNSQTGYFVRLGGAKSNVRKVGVAFSDCSIELSNKDGHAIQVMECVGVTIERIYSEGTQTAGRSNRFVIFDGGDASAFFGVVRDCVTYHFDTTFIAATTGTGSYTLFTLDNCHALGDVASFPNSIGLRVTSLQGSGARVAGCNFESCGKGVIAENGCKSFTVEHCRFEGNTVDVEAQATAASISVIGGLVDDTKITDPQHKVNFFGANNGLDKQCVATINAPTTVRSVTNLTVPFTIADDVGFTTDAMHETKNSAGSVVLSWSAQGKFKRINNATPAAINAACTDLPTAVALLNQIRTQLIAVGICV